MYQDCCGGHIIDKQGQGCCKNKPFNLESHDCCEGDITDASIFPGEWKNTIISRVIQVHFDLLTPNELRAQTFWTYRVQLTDYHGITQKSINHNKTITGS